MSPEIVLLDAGGTLFTETESRDEVYVRVLAANGSQLALPEMARLREELHDAMPAVFGGHVRYTDGWFREFIRRLLLRVRSPADAEAVRLQLADHFSRVEHFVLYADTLPALEELASRGLRLGVVSNWSDRLPALLDGLGLTRFFEVVVVSAVVGATKPERAIFRHALDRLAAAPGRVLHVGDHAVNDLAGARRAGLGALLLDRSGQSAGRTDAIASLEELALRVGA
jgi:putative hydrolase of the HAD superfamily